MLCAPNLCLNRYGFFSNKRIVLYDTLISSCSEEECVAVLAHELGGCPKCVCLIEYCRNVEWRKLSYHRAPISGWTEEECEAVLALELGECVFSKARVSAPDLQQVLNPELVSRSDESSHHIIFISSCLEEKCAGT